MHLLDPEPTLQDPVVMHPGFRSLLSRCLLFMLPRIRIHRKAMAKFLIFYTFHRLDPLSINRLRQIRALNPGAEVVPCFGAGMQLPRSRVPRRIALEVLMRLLQLPGIESAISERSRRKLGNLSKRVRSAVRDMGLEPHFAFTPEGFDPAHQRAPCPRKRWQSQGPLS